MSGEFLEKAQELEKRFERVGGMAGEPFCWECWPEILAVVKAAVLQREHGSGLPCEQVKDLYAAIDTLDAKAKEKL